MNTKAFVLVFFVFGICSTVFGQKEIDEQLNNYWKHIKWHHEMDTRTFVSFLEISDSQKKLFGKLEDEFEKRVRDIKADSTLAKEKKLEELRSLYDELNNRFEKKVLLKVQRKLLTKWRLYRLIRSHGIGNSLVNGWMHSI